MNLPVALRKVGSFGLIALGFASLAQLSHAQALTTATITDPAFGNMKALTVTIPSGWQFQGTVVRGPDCFPNSFPTFRAYSRDGLTEIRLPGFNWSFHPAIRMKTIAQPYRERVENVATSLNANNRTPGFHATVDTAGCVSKRSTDPSSLNSACACGSDAA
jgi:hypothetical protein